MMRKFIAVFGVVLFSLVLSKQVFADEMVQQMQVDLHVLGIYKGAATGDLDMKTEMAIGKYQKMNKQHVTGKPSLQLAVDISSQADVVRSGGVNPMLASNKAPQSRADDQKQCLEAKRQEALKGQKKKQLWSKMANAGKRIAGRLGEHELVQDIETVRSTAYDTAELANVAKEFGISTEAAQKCLTI